MHSSSKNLKDMQRVPNLFFHFRPKSVEDTKSLIDKPITHKKSTSYVGRSRLTSIDNINEIEEKQNRSKSSTKGYHSYVGVQRSKSVKN